jgi:hypothetical protein
MARTKEAMPSPVAQLRRVMWKLVNGIDGSGSGAEPHRKLSQAIRAALDALANFGALMDIAVGLIY